MEKKPIASKVLQVAKQVPAAVQQVVTHPLKQPTAAMPAAMPAANAPTKALCQSHMHRYVEVQAADGYCYDGIVEHVDDQWLCLAVPGAVEDARGFFPHAPFYPPFGYRPRRFNRLVLPLAGLIGLSLLPYYW
ncbi:hypothetical protein [Cohnella sp. GCM10027633]|uniref:hypothetical protein n=1 Tax=unclassified Cohnella TaxID=2636738 RepID=UPI0036333120